MIIFGKESLFPDVTLGVTSNRLTSKNDCIFTQPIDKTNTRYVNFMKS
jgi:hypothetical protein